MFENEFDETIEGFAEIFRLGFAQGVLHKNHPSSVEFTLDWGKMLPKEVYSVYKAGYEYGAAVDWIEAFQIWCQQENV